MEAGEIGAATGWTVACSKTETPGIRVKALKPGRSYMFRVACLNGKNANAFSYASEPIGTLHGDWYRNKLGTELVKKNGGTATTDVLKNKMVLLYFSAHWCPPCRQFTPMLAEFYEKMKQQGKEFEVIFVSLDREKSSFEEYLSQMPWYAIPYESSMRMTLAQKYMVQGIPNMKVLDATDGSIVVSNAVGMLTQEVFEQWESKAFAAQRRADEVASQRNSHDDKEEDSLSKKKGGKKWVCEGDTCKMMDN
eukprot:jgi/Bigna1/65303/fgenesh1_kg.104_\